MSTTLISGHSKASQRSYDYWTQLPVMSCRPYVRLETYDISEDVDMLNAKLLTSKRGGCDGAHCMEQGSLGSFRCCRHQPDQHASLLQC
jgi:hypothetical protein